MQRSTLPSSRVIRRLAPLLLASTLTFAACGGGSSDKSTTTSGSQRPSTAAAAASTAMPAAPTVAATSEATSTSTSVATAAATSAATQPASTATSTSSGGNTANNGDLQEVADALAKVKSYKVTLNIYEGDATTPAYVSTIETVEPDKTHTVTSFAGQTIESIQIGDDTYTKLGDTWQKTSGLGEAAATPVDGSDVIDTFADSESAGINVTQKGEDTINGEATVVYELTSNDSSVLTIWVGKDDHLPRKSEVKSDSEHIEIIYSDYGKDFDIKAPL